MKYASPKIEDAWVGDKEGLHVTVYDCDMKHNNYRRRATPEETQAAILYWIADIHARIGKPE